MARETLPLNRIMHKLLETIMRKPISSAPMRIQKMILKLQPYEFRLVYVKG